MVVILLIYVSNVVHLVFYVLDLDLINVQVVMEIMDFFIKLVILPANKLVQMEHIKILKLIYAVNAKEDV